MVDWREHLDTLRVPDEDLSEAIGRCEGLRAALFKRLLTPAQSSAATPPEFLTAKEAARLCKCSVQFIYDHGAQLGGGQIGNGRKKRWRFREKDVLAYMEREGL